MRQRVLITAAASGIGREIARAFHANVGAMFVCDLDADGLPAVACELPGAHTVRCHIGDREIRQAS